MYSDLLAWTKSYELTLQIYKATRSFPREETYGIVSQIRRASASIPVNIAEGSMRRSPKEFQQFLYIARGSMTEVEVWLRLAHDLGYLDDDNFKPIREHLGEVGKLIHGLLNSIKSD
jgi:four helix bundle protein